MKIKILLIGLLLASMVYAWNYGQVVTQQQIDAVDFDSVDLDFKIGDRILPTLTNPRIIVKFSYADISYNDSHYIIVNRTSQITYHKLEYRACRNYNETNDKTFCKAEAIQTLKDRYKGFKQSHREKLTRLQTIDEAVADLNEINLGGVDFLNE